MNEQELDIEAIVKENNLEKTEHDRVWWTHLPPHPRAFDAATEIAGAIPELRVIGSESRFLPVDVHWKLLDPSVVQLKFYPIRANHWTEKVIEDIRDARTTEV